MTGDPDLFPVLGEMRHVEVPQDQELPLRRFVLVQTETGSHRAHVGRAALRMPLAVALADVVEEHR